MGTRELIGEGVVRGAHFQMQPDGRIQCDACPRHCRMHEGQRGFCYVREVRGNALVSTTYGRASGFCIDPIEKKPLAHFLPGTSVLSFGTAGCNLGCKFCQNWDISKARSDDKLMERASPAAIARAAKDAGCRSIALTYNDPVIWAEYAIDCAEAAREAGIEPVAVTAGYVAGAAREAFFRPMAAANVDLKAFTETFYETLCFARLAPVLDTLAWIKRETTVWLEVTTLLIAGQNDSEAEVDALCSWFVENLGTETPLHFTAYHPDFRLDAPATPPGTVMRARRQALSLGLKHVYTGNVHDPAGQTTSCAGCGSTLIARDGYRVGSYRIRADGTCPDCGHALAGKFEAKAGQWGARRLRLAITERSSS